MVSFGQSITQPSLGTFYSFEWFGVGNCLVIKQDCFFFFFWLAFLLAEHLRKES